MAEDGSDATGSPLLRGLFGAFQTGAAERADTSSIWSSLRTAAGTWQAQAQGLPQPYDPAALEEAGRGILSAQGINAATVSTFRGVAGSWLGAKQNLQALDNDEQITASEIFTPPWARTANAAVPDRYRLRTQWQITPAAGDPYTLWTTNELDGPLTTKDDLLGQAEPDPQTQSGKAILASQGVPGLLDFDLEQV